LKCEFKSAETKFQTTDSCIVIYTGEMN